MQGTQALQAQAVPQNIQIENAVPIVLRVPTIGTDGQISYQTLQILSSLQNLVGMQVHNSAPQQLTITPVQTAMVTTAGGQTTTQMQPVVAGAGIGLSSAQIATMPGLQTINLSSLGSAGIQVQQLQGVPVSSATTTVSMGKQWVAWLCPQRRCDLI